jgi:hypothetical protein
MRNSRHSFSFWHKTTRYRHGYCGVRHRSDEPFVHAPYAHRGLALRLNGRLFTDPDKARQFLLDGKIPGEVDTDGG